MSENKGFSSRKKLIIVLAALALLMLMLYGITLLIPLFDSSEPQDTMEIIANYDFCEPDFSENIFEDEAYLKRIEHGIITYDDKTVTVTVDPDNAVEHGTPVKIIVDMVYSAINGDHKEYNSYFSAKYFEKNQPKAKFTMQKIYNASIQYFSQETAIEGKDSYNTYTYKLKYYIQDNNGTFRKDIGDDARVQYVTVSDRNGEFKIDSITTAIYK